jgi:hypothetical protein
LARKTVAYPSRQQIINNDPFAMSSLTVGYSMSKKKRWLLAEYFEENVQDFQVSVKFTHILIVKF